MEGAKVALDALRLVDPQLEDVPSAGEAQERSEGADVPAPEPLADDVEQDQAEKDRPDDEPAGERAVDGHGLDGLGQLVAEPVEVEAVKKAGEKSQALAEGR